jgi:hypothetical protein
MKTFIELAAEAAEKLAEEYSNQPELEFLAWVNIALQREAMVSQAYDATFIDSQLEKWSSDRAIPAAVIHSIRRALMGVWAQESAHREYFAAVLKEVNPPKTLLGRIRTRLREVRGILEGRLLGDLVSRSDWRRHAAQLAIIMGTKINAVPAYVRSLRKTSFAEFCNINGDLEHTAVVGYQRMLNLGRTMPNVAVIAETPLMIDLRRTEKDERYHEALFRALSCWPPPPGSPQVHYGMPSSAPVPVVVSVDSAHDVIANAKAIAYGADAELLGNTTVEVSLEKISHDPLIAYMRRFVRDAAFVKGSAAAGVAAKSKTAKYVGGGAAVGLALGAILGGGKGAAIGALVGGALGTGAQVLKGQEKELPKQIEDVINRRPAHETPATHVQPQMRAH